MPKFTEKEKLEIQKKILSEGEKLFATIGLKKVTIDNLSHAAKISHSAFYSFYESKEQLFMEINMNKQKSIYKKLNALIIENSTLPPKKLVKLYLGALHKELFLDPIISLMNGEVMEQISRKVSSEIMQQNDLIDKQAFCKLEEVGIQFNYSVDKVIKVSQVMFVGITCLDGIENQAELIEILLDALIEKLVK